MSLPKSEQEQQRVFSLAAESVPVAPMPLRTSNAIDAPVEMRGEDVVQRYGDREYRVRGLAQEHKPGRAASQSSRAGGERARGHGAARGQAGPRSRAAARGVHQAGGGRAGRQGRRDPPRRGPVDPEAGDAARRADRQSACAERAGGHDDRRGARPQRWSCCAIRA